jgi:hypothetical protein
VLPLESCKAAVKTPAAYQTAAGESEALRDTGASDVGASQATETGMGVARGSKLMKVAMIHKVERGQLS